MSKVNCKKRFMTNGKKQRFNSGLWFAFSCFFIIVMLLSGSAWAFTDEGEWEQGDSITWDVPYQTQATFRNWSTSCMPTSGAMIINFFYAGAQIRNFHNTDNDDHPWNSIEVNGSYQTTGQRIYALGIMGGNDANTTLTNYLTNYPKNGIKQYYCTSETATKHCSYAHYGPLHNETFSWTPNASVTNGGSTYGNRNKLVNYLSSKHAIELQSISGSGQTRISNIRNSLYKGPVVMSVTYSGYSHLVVIIGVTAEGDFLVNDPWGGSVDNHPPHPYKDTYSEYEVLTDNSGVPTGKLKAYGDIHTINYAYSAPVSDNFDRNDSPFSPKNVPVEATVTFSHDASGAYNSSYNGDGNYTGIRNGFTIWNSSQGEWYYYYKQVKIIAFPYTKTTKSEDETTAARWTPEFTESGRYRVLAGFYVDSKGNSSEVNYRVFHRDGEASVVIDQSTSDGAYETRGNIAYKSLGDYCFNAGVSEDNGSVKLVNTSNVADKDINVDIMRFVYLNNDCALPYDEIGKYSEDDPNNDARFVSAYFKYTQAGFNLGEPYDNRGGIYVHDWEGVWIQDFDNGNKALILNEDMGEVFLVRDDFWEKYGPVRFGEPAGDDEETEDSTSGEVSRQYFENGYMELDKRRDEGRQWFFIHNNVGLKAPDKENPNEFREIFVKGYIESGGNIGDPYNDNNGTVYVHDWSGVWIQNFNGGDYGVCAIILNENMGEAFLVRSGFWEKYWKEGGPGKFGVPIENEYHVKDENFKAEDIEDKDADFDFSYQSFEKPKKDYPIYDFSYQVLERYKMRWDNKASILQYKRFTNKYHSAIIDRDSHYNLQILGDINEITGKFKLESVEQLAKDNEAVIAINGFNYRDIGNVPPIPPLGCLWTDRGYNYIEPTTTVVMGGQVIHELAGNENEAILSFGSSKESKIVRHTKQEYIQNRDDIAWGFGTTTTLKILENGECKVGSGYSKYCDIGGDYCVSGENEQISAIGYNATQIMFVSTDQDNDEIDDFKDLCDFFRGAGMTDAAMLDSGSAATLVINNKVKNGTASFCGNFGENRYVAYAIGVIASKIGLKALGSQNQNEFQDEFQKAYDSVANLGDPFDDKGGEYVHDWDGIWIQNFKGDKYGITAIILNEDMSEAFVVRSGFWEKYWSEGGPNFFGAPKENEYRDGDLSYQKFESGTMRWDHITNSWSFNPLNDMIGLKVPGEQNRDEFQNEFIKAYESVSNLGDPFDDNEAGEYVHEWDGIWIQNFNGDAYGETAIILNESMNEAFVVRSGFWEKYWSEGGPNFFGAPMENEYRDGDFSYQKFENGTMKWDHNTSSWSFNPPGECPSKDGLYCGNSSLGQDPNTLYRCESGKYMLVSSCSNGCLSNPPGTNDACITAGGGSERQEALGRLLLKDNYSGISYGYLEEPYSFAGNEAHAGIDFPASAGSPVYAPVSGVYSSSSTEILGKASYIVLSNGKRLFIHHMKNLIYGYRDKGQKIGEIFDDHVHAELRVEYSGTYLVGGASCGGTCTLEEIKEKTDDPSEVVTLVLNDKIGLKAPGEQNRDEFQNEFIKAYDSVANLGEPFDDNGAGEYVHEWDGIWIQNFKGDAYGETAVILNESMNEAFVVRSGFWEKYWSEGGPQKFGAPMENEYRDGDFSYQKFESGTMKWDHRTSTWSFNPTSVTPVNCSTNLNFNEEIIIPDNEVRFVDIPIEVIQDFLEEEESVLQNVDLDTYRLDPEIDERSGKTWSIFIGEGKEPWGLDELKNDKPTTEKYSPAEIIYWAAKENNVNPILMLAYLEKEYEFIEDSLYDNGIISNLQKALNRAVGYGMAEGGDDPKYYGFLAQMTGLSYEINLELPKYQGEYAKVVDGKEITIRSSFAHFHYDYTPHFISASNLFFFYNKYRVYFINKGYSPCDGSVTPPQTEEKNPIKFSDSTTVYYYSNGYYWPIFNAETYALLGFTKSKCSDPATPITEPTQEDFELVETYQDTDKSNFSLKNTVVPSEGILVKIADKIGPNTCNPRTSREASTVYIFYCGKFHPFMNEQAFTSHDMNWDDIVEITQDLFNKFGEGYEIYEDTDLACGFAETVGNRIAGDIKIVSLDSPNESLGSNGTVTIDGNAVQADWLTDGISLNLYSVPGFIWDTFVTPLHIEAVNENGLKVADTYYPFKDISPKDWYTRPVMKMWRENVLSGYASVKSNTFKPNQDASRAEYLTAAIVAEEMANAPGRTYPDYTNAFIDVSTTDWFANITQYAKDHNIIQGCKPEEMRFCPHDPIKRTSGVTITVRAFEKFKTTLTAIEQGTLKPSDEFPDVTNPDDWFYPYIYTAKEEGLVHGYQDGEFKPAQNASRADMAVINCIAAFGPMACMTGLNIVQQETPPVIPGNDETCTYTEPVNTNCTFSDIAAGDPNAWYVEPVNALCSTGILVGVEKNGQRVYEPAQDANLVETLAVFTSASDYENAGPGVAVSDPWYKFFFDYAQGKGLPVNMDNPGAPVTKSDALTYLAKLFYNYTGSDPVQFLISKGISNGDDLNSNMNRATLATLAYRAIIDTGKCVPFGLYDSPLSSGPDTPDDNNNPDDLNPDDYNPGDDRETLILNDGSIATTCTFSDVDQNKWFTEPVQALCGAGILIGYSKEGKRVYLPAQDATLAETLAVFISASDYQKLGPKSSDTDPWYRFYFEYAQDKGFPVNEANAGSTVTKRDALTYLAEFFYNYSNTDAAQYIINKGISSDSELDSPINRAVLATLAYRAANDAGKYINYYLVNSPPPADPATSSYAQAIADKAKGEVGKTTPYVSSQYTYCARFVRMMHGKTAVYADAKSMCNHYADLGIVNTGTSPPTGAAVCYLPGTSNWGYGHVAIATGDGTEIGATSLKYGVTERDIVTGSGYQGWISADDFADNY